MKRSEASEINDTAGNSEILTQGTSPTSTGPAGGYFEGQVGASYLLSLLVGAEPRGLSGTTIDWVKLQRGAEGHPLDDVIVEAHDQQGHTALLEVQVKRSISFAPSDPVFRDVVGQIAKVAPKPEFLKSRYELAIAIAQTSHKIDGPYQTVLTWARQLGDPATFMNRILRPGAASDDMRTFVRTFTTHLQNFSVPSDNETVWHLLSRLQILPFDFPSTGSASTDLATERATRALHPEETTRAGDFWKALTELAIEIASSGGDITRDRLVERLRQRSFRLAEQRQNLPALSALAEASLHALSDIGNRVGGTMLMRQERVTAVYAALDQGRYVEIRGDAGVGKSAVLKHFAEQLSEQARVIVLSPGRTIAKGWLQFSAALGFAGTARELLVDLAASGGATLFLDNLDFFAQEERLTVIDLVREAASIPGISVIATARRDYGVLEPSWLPGEILNQLGRAEPVVIDELTESEIEELRNAAPQLRELLTDNHPARQVSRNLFRLSRLANHRSDTQGLRTEVDMAKQWWRSADGNNDDKDQHRERARVLRALTEQALLRSEHLDTASFPARAVNALLASKSLRDLGNDRMTFRHDVLRDWAVANLLSSDPSRIQRLPLKRPATADLVRGVELAARMTIEGASTSTLWESFVDALSTAEVHGSWRRAAILAIVHSEIGMVLLERAKGYLLNNKAEALRELIRLVLAVDVEPARKRLLEAGIDPKLIPHGLNLPSGRSWVQLITWLLSLGESLPPAAIPEIVDLYTAWSRGTLGRDALTPMLVRFLYQWLIKINASNDSEAIHPRQPFNGELAGDQLGPLAEDLTTGFLLFCNHTPDLAKAYLHDLRRNPEQKQATAILKFRGALAQAAPEELADLTAEILIPKEDESDDHHRFSLEGPFKYRDLDFIPASPAQGPFLELLVHAREPGLRLIRKLIDHAIFFGTDGQNFGTNAITILLLDGKERTFSWVESYEWSREMGSSTPVLPSALMALEAWAHRRIDASEAFETVLADVLGPAKAPTPAAYVLVAVDLLLSHWPNSRTAAIPFLGCPELLCMDRQRIARENVKFPDIFGLNALQKEPAGLADLASLKARPSRRWMLDQMLSEYVFDKENRELLVERLQRAATRLGPPKDKLGLLSPAFMTVHALNLLDPKNWHQKTLQTKDGPVEGWQYVSPASEVDHIQSIDDEGSRDRRASQSLQIQINAALNDPSLSSPALPAAAVEWAQKHARTAEEEEDRDWMQKNSIVVAALIGVRDGGSALIQQHEIWMRQTFIEALQSKKDPVWEMRTGIQFNPVAMAFVGIVLLLTNRFVMEDVRTLLEAAADESSAAAHGFAETAGMLAAMDERLPRSILRCSLAACVQPRPDWRLPEAETGARERYEQRIRAAIEAELGWLNGTRDEPQFPPFPDERPHSRDRYISFRGRRRERIERPPAPEVLTHHHSAALWLNGAGALFDVAKRPWLRDIVKSYTSWTRIMNGSEFKEDEELDSPPREWNIAYFRLLAYCLPGLSSEQIEDIAVIPISATTERAFLEILTTFLSDVDAVYFNEHTLAQPQAVYLRTRLAQELMKGRLWKDYARERATSTEIHLGPAIAVSFFNEYHSFGRPKCYLLPNAIERVDPFLPILKELTPRVEGACFLRALVGPRTLAYRREHQI